MRKLKLVMVGNGQEALDCLRRRSFGVVLLDVNMSGRSGLDTLRQAKAQTERAQAAHDYVKALADLLEACGLSEDFGKYMARADALKVE